MPRGPISEMKSKEVGYTCFEYLWGVAFWNEVQQEASEDQRRSHIAWRCRVSDRDGIGDDIVAIIAHVPEV